MPESATEEIIARLPAWREEDMELICGIANAGGGRIVITLPAGNQSRKMRRFRKTFELIPRLAQTELGISCSTEPVMDGTELCLEIVVPAATTPVNYLGTYYLYTNGENTVIDEGLLTSLFEGAENATWEHQIQPFVRQEDIDGETLLRMTQRLEPSSGSSESSADRTPSETLIAYGMKDAHTDTLTNIGVLLLHRAPHTFIPGAQVRIGLFDENGQEVRAPETVSGPLISQHRRTMELLYSLFLPRAIEMQNGDSGNISALQAPKREEATDQAFASSSAQDAQNDRHETMLANAQDAPADANEAIVSLSAERITELKLPPEQAVSEALLNALVHKDYESELPIRISVTPYRLYIDNVGRPPASWTEEDLIGRHNSRPNNPALANALNMEGIFNGWGNGISTLRRTCQRAGVPIPKIALHGDETEVTFAIGLDAESQARSVREVRGKHAAPSTFESDEEQRHSSTSTRSDGDRTSQQAQAQPNAPLAGAEDESDTKRAAQSSTSASPARPAYIKPQPDRGRRATFKERSVAAANRLNMTSTDEYILKVIETNGRVTAIRIAEVLGVSESTVRRSFRRLREYGFIERIGSDKAGYWRLID